MKKQVKSAESQVVHRLHHDEALPRRILMNQSKMAFKDVASLNSGLKISTPPADQQLTTIQIPTVVTVASSLKHTALTPAQREYLHTIAASYSTAHVRGLITQHYMNVLHRCIRADYSPNRDVFMTSVASPENVSEDHQSKPQSGAHSRSKLKGKTSARHSQKSFLPKIPNRQARAFNTSASKHKKVKKWTSPTPRRKNPRRARIRLSDKEEEETRPDDSLGECLSSLSIGESDDDIFSGL